MRSMVEGVARLTKNIPRHKESVGTTPTDSFHKQSFLFHAERPISPDRNTRMDAEGSQRSSRPHPVRVHAGPSERGGTVPQSESDSR